MSEEEWRARAYKAERQVDALLVTLEVVRQERSEAEAERDEAEAARRRRRVPCRCQWCCQSTPPEKRGLGHSSCKG